MHGKYKSTPAKSVAAAVDTSFETRLNTMKNGIFRLWVTSEKFISINNISGKSREEID